MMSLAVTPLFAQDKLVEQLTVEGRGDYQREYVDGHTLENRSGFKGKYFNLRMSGQITDRLSYSLRQRFNRAALDASFFNATDWFYLNYQLSDYWTLSAGKQVVDIGGYEYDNPPIDLYFCSEYWNHTPCYAWGVSIASQVGKNDLLRFQICESIDRQFEVVKHLDLYSYNLMWYGKHGPWSTKWSVNLFEWDKGKFMNYIALGNEFQFSKQVSLELDYMNRAAAHQTFFFKDCSVMSQLNYQPSDYVKFFAKATYDVNQTDIPADYTVISGTEMTRVGAGVEYFPLGDQRLRLHATYCYSWGNNPNPEPVQLDKHSVVDMGVTWRLNIIK